MRPDDEARRIADELEQEIRGARRGDAWEPGTPEDGEPQPVPVLVRLADVAPEPVRWLWQHWIPDGALTVLDGDPGLGKSTLTLDLAARVSRGWAMPPGSGPDPERLPANVLLLGAEDVLKYTVRPRLDAAGADSERVHSLEGVRTGDVIRDPVLPWDLALVAERVEKWDVRLIVVDPLMAFLGGEYDAHKDQDIRRCLRPMRDLAERLGCAILLLRHLNKLSGGAALYRGGASIGITGAARASLLVGRDPEDEAVRVLAMNKSNLGPIPRSLSYRLEAVNGTSRVAWLGETDLAPHEILWHHVGGPPKPRGRPSDALEDAKNLLADLVDEGPVPVETLRAEAARRKIHWSSVRRAKEELGLEHRRVAGEWFWERPEMAVE